MKHTRITKAVLRGAALVSSISILLTVLSCVGCKSANSKSAIAEKKDMARTIAIIYELQAYIVDAQASTGTKPPLDMHDLVNWIEAACPKFYQESFVDVERGVLRDAWGQELLLIVKNNKLVAIGSCGPGGVWDGGSKDDILREIPEAITESE